MKTLKLIDQTNTSTLLSSVHPAKISVVREAEQELQAIALFYFLMPCGLLKNANLLSLFGKMFLTQLIRVYEQSLAHSEWQDITQKLKSCRQRNSAHHTSEKGYLSLPTPTALSKPGGTSYRSPGSDRLETVLRSLPTPVASDNQHNVNRQIYREKTRYRRRSTKSRRGHSLNLDDTLYHVAKLIPDGHNSHPALREWMMAFPIGWTDLEKEDIGQIPTISPPQITTPRYSVPDRQARISALGDAVCPLQAMIPLMRIKYLTSLVS